MCLWEDLGNRKLPCGTRQKKKGCMQKGSRPIFLSSALHFLKNDTALSLKKNNVKDTSISSCYINVVQKKEPHLP